MSDPKQRRNYLIPALLVLLLAGTVAAVFLLRPAEELIERPGITVLLPDDELSAVEFYMGMLWAGGRDGLYCIDPNTHQVERIAGDGIPDFKYVKALLPHNDELWVGYEGGVAVLRDGGWLTTDAVPDLRVNALCADPDGESVWAGTFGGAVRFDLELGVLETLTAAQGLRADMVNVIAAGPDGSVWFGSFLEGRGVGGLSIRRADGSWQLIGADEGLPHHDITSIMPWNGQMLVGCGMLNRGGAAFLIPNEQDGQSWQVAQTLSVEDGLAGEKVRSIFVRGDDEVWFCSESDGIAVWRPGGFAALLTMDQGLSDNEVKDIAAGPDGKLYLGSRYGLTELTPEAIRELIPQ